MIIGYLDSLGYTQFLSDHPPLSSQRGTAFLLDTGEAFNLITTMF